MVLRAHLSSPFRRSVLPSPYLSTMPASDPGIRVLKPLPPDCADILTPAALEFLASLARRFEPERRRLLERRVARQQQLDAGQLPDFLPETRDIREREWT